MPELIPAEPGTPCDCWGLETCERCYVPPADLTPATPRKNLYDLPIFGWAWTEDGRDRRA